MVGQQKCHSNPNLLLQCLTGSHLQLEKNADHVNSLKRHANPHKCTTVKSITANISESMKSNLIHFHFLVLPPYPRPTKYREFHWSCCFKNKRQSLYFQIKHHWRYCFLTNRVLSCITRCWFETLCIDINAFQNNFYLVTKEHLFIIKILKGTKIIIIIEK